MKVVAVAVVIVIILVLVWTWSRRERPENFGNWYPYRFWTWGNALNPWGGPYASPLYYSAPLARYRWQYYPWYTYGSYSPYGLAP